MKNNYPNNTQHDMSSSPCSLPENGKRVVADDPDLLTWGDVGRCNLEPIPKDDAVLAAETGSSEAGCCSHANDRDETRLVNADQTRT